MRAVGRGDEHRRAADRLEGAHRRVDAAGNDAPGARKKRAVGVALGVAAGVATGVATGVEM